MDSVSAFFTRPVPTLERCYRPASTLEEAYDDRASDRTRTTNAELDSYASLS